MNAEQLRILDNQIALTNSRIQEQSRLIDKAITQRDALSFFKSDLEELRVRLNEAGDTGDKHA